MLSLTYGYDDSLTFVEQYRFDFPFADNIDDGLLDVAFQTLFFMAGVSYYKMYLAPRIVVSNGELDVSSANFFSKTYQRGLGELFYKNNLSPTTNITFPVTDKSPSTPPTYITDGKLIAIGGGKDSLVSVEVLREQNDVAVWSLGHRAQLAPLMEIINLPSLWVDRRLDPAIATHNKEGAYNGHIPISAIFAAVGAVVAVLSGNRDVVVSNESSASDPTLEYQGVQINHQYSKSLEFEEDFQQYLAHRLGENVHYYSLLRPFTELRIAEIYSHYFDKYNNVFSSCNRAFTQNSNTLFWCGHCAKCAFTFLILTPFVSRSKLETLWGKNLLLEPDLETTYRQLLGIEGDKPLDCVGEIKESRAAMRIAQKEYPELDKYEFDLPEDYDYRRVSKNVMPPEIYKVLEAFTSKIGDTSQLNRHI